MEEKDLSIEREIAAFREGLEIMASVKQTINAAYAATERALSHGSTFAAGENPLDTIGVCVREMEKRGLQHYNEKFYVDNVDKVTFLQRWFRRWRTQRSIRQSIETMFKKENLDEHGRLIMKRIRVIREIYETERTYVELLLKLEKCFVLSLKRRKRKSKLFDDKDVVAFWDNVHTILICNTRLLTELTRAIFDPDVVHVPVGQIFLDAAPSLLHYVPYIQFHDHNIRLLQSRLASNKETVEWLQEGEQEAGNTLQSFLILPVQRVPRYVLLLNELLKATPKEFAEHDLIEKAISKVREVASTLNEQKDSLEHSQRLSELSEQIRVPYIDLLEPHRVFLNAGNLYRCWKEQKWGAWSMLVRPDVMQQSITESQGKGDNKDKTTTQSPGQGPIMAENPTLFYFVLCNDVLLFARQIEKHPPRYELVSFFLVMPYWRMDEEPEEKHPTQPHFFRLCFGNTKMAIILAAPTRHEKNTWVNKLREAIETQVKRLLSGTLTAPSSDGLKLAKHSGKIYRKDRIFWARYIVRFKGHSMMFFEDNEDNGAFVDWMANITRFQVRCAERKVRKSFSVEFYKKHEASIFLSFKTMIELLGWVYVWCKSGVNVNLDTFHFTQDQWSNLGDYRMEEYMFQSATALVEERRAKGEVCISNEDLNLKLDEYYRSMLGVVKSRRERERAPSDAYDTESDGEWSEKE